MGPTPIHLFPFQEDVLDEEALILKRAFGHERFFWDRSDPVP